MISVRHFKQRTHDLGAAGVTALKPGREVCRV